MNSSKNASQEYLGYISHMAGSYTKRPHKIQFSNKTTKHRILKLSGEFLTPRDDPGF